MLPAEVFVHCTMHGIQHTVSLFHFVIMHETIEKVLKALIA